MPDQPEPPPSDRFKAEMPQIPGIGAAGTPRTQARRVPVLIVVGSAAVLAAVVVGGQLLSKKRSDTPAAPTPTIDATVDPPSALPELTVPVVSEDHPVIVQVGELAKAWESRQFSFPDRATGVNVPAILVRLPGASGAQAAGYWAFVLKEAYGRCQLEYVTDLTRLRTDYGYRSASHPMVGNPCSRTVYDPLKYGAIAGNVLARGAIVQGTDLRPPLGIEVRIRGKEILAVRME